MSGSRRGSGAGFMLPGGAAEDLGRHDCIRLAIQRAFPLPSSGAFTDVLAAIDAGSAPRSQNPCRAETLGAKRSVSVER